MFSNVMNNSNILLNVAGAVVHYDTLINKLPILGLKNKNIRFNVYEGPNMCQWNGGRINRDITLTEEIVNRYNKFGITVSLTFTNHTIDLNDPIGNSLLEILDRSGKKHNITNKIILINEDLRSYISKKYNFQLIYSITGHPSDIKLTDKEIERYKDLESKYDWIVPKFELVFEPKFYSAINTSKYELLINDTCLYGCKYYHEHFYEIAKQNSLSKNPWKILGHDHCFKVEECWLPKFNPDIGSDSNRKKYGEKLGMDYTPEMIQKAINLGYLAFKISGRENSTFQITGEIERFIKDLNFRSQK
jgi:hypothetical protein